MDKELLIKEFEKDLENQIQKMKKLYNPERLLQMIEKEGYYNTAKKVIIKPYTKGFEILIEAGKLELTIEALVLNPKYESIFSEEELKACRRKLR